jgi:hypothetical protein
MRALEPVVVDGIWSAVAALLPAPDRSHPLGCHRPVVMGLDLRCLQCGVTTSIAIEDLLPRESSGSEGAGDEGAGVALVDAAAIARTCASGGSFAEDAPGRCRCRSADVTATRVALIDEPATSSPKA